MPKFEKKLYLTTVGVQLYSFPVDRNTNSFHMRNDKQEVSTIPWLLSCYNNSPAERIHLFYLHVHVHVGSLG